MIPVTHLAAGQVARFETLFTGRVLTTTGQAAIRWQPGAGEVMPGLDGRIITIRGQNKPGNHLIVRLVGNIEGIANPADSSLNVIAPGGRSDGYNKNHYTFFGLADRRQTVVADRYVMAVEAAVWGE